MASPLDSDYASGVARILFQNKTQRDQLGQQGDQDTEDFNTALQRMARQRGIDLLNQNHQANREGLFYSGQLTKRRGEVEHDYADRQGDAQRDYDRRVAARAQALAQLGTITADPNSALGYTGTGGAALDLQDAYNDAVRRQTERDAQSQLAAAQAPGAPAPGAPAPAPAPAATQAPSFTGRIGNNFVGPQMWDARGFYVIPNYGGAGRSLHLYPNGRQVLVK